MMDVTHFLRRHTFISDYFCVAFCPPVIFTSPVKALSVKRHCHTNETRTLQTHPQEIIRSAQSLPLTSNNNQHIHDQPKILRTQINEAENKHKLANNTAETHIINSFL